MQLLDRNVLLLTGAFLAVSLPATFKLVHALAGKYVPVVDGAGKPTIAGSLIHSVVFALIAAYLITP